MGTDNYSTLERVLIILMVVVSTSHAQECSSPSLTFGGQFPVGPEISVKVGAEYTLAQHDVSNVRSVSVKATAPDLPVYIQARITAGRLTILTNELFADYEKLDDKLVFFNVVVFTCESGAVREMTFRQSIKEENNHTPLFDRESYDIKIPLPLPREFNIQQFVEDGKGILAHDYDITKNKISFSVGENDFFSVRSVAGSSRTEFSANLITKVTLTKIEPPITVLLTAEDEWVPARWSQTRLTISGDPVIVFITPPEFEQSLYRMTYRNGETFAPFRVSLVSGTFDNSVSFQLTGDDADFFTIAPASDRGSATVTLRAGAQIGEKQLLSASVSASRTGTDSLGRTALVVEVAVDPKITPTFEASFYSGTIDRNRVITVETIRLVPSTSDTSVVVRLSGDDAKYFTMTFANNQVAVAPSSELTDGVLKEKSFFLVTVQAEKPGVGTGDTLLILSVEKPDGKDPRFEQTLYEATITETGALVVPTVRILPDSFVSGLEYGYSGDVTLFTITPDNVGLFTIRSNNVTPEKVADRSYLLLTIAAKVEGEEKTHAVIVVKVLRDPVVMPKFTSPFLTGELIEKTLEVRLPNVQFVPETFSSATKVSVVDDRYFFDIQEYFPANVFRLYLRGNVTKELLQGIDRIPLTVLASNPNSDDAYCVVTVDIIRTAAPVFERLIYDGVIDETKQLVQDVEVRLVPDSTDETVQFALDGTDAGFFQLEPLPSATEGVRIKLKAPLSDEEYESRDHFQLNLKATKQQALEDALVPVVVYVKKASSKIPTFGKPLYKSRLDVDLKLVPFEPITLEQGSYVDASTVAIRSSNSDFFGVSLQQGQVTIQLVKAVDEPSLSAFDRFEFVVECTNPGMASGFTTILIDIDRTVAPEFPERFYSGAVNEGLKEIRFEKAVSLRPETIVSGTEYVIEGVDSSLVRFVVSNDRSLSFLLRDEVTVEQLKLRSEIAFIVVARNPHNDQPSVVACTVKIVRAAKPEFAMASFHGKIVEGETVVDFGEEPIAWEAGTVNEFTSFVVLDTQSSDIFNFTFSEDRQVLDVVLRPGVRWDQVRSSVYYHLSLEASNPGSEWTQCTLVVDVENQPAITPVFSKAIYRGSLREGTKEVIFSAADTITIQAGTMMPTFQYFASEGDANLFDVELVEENKLKVSLKDDINPSAIEGRDMLSFVVTINNAYSADDSATVVVTIKLDDIITPVFSKLLYNGAFMEGSNVLSLQDSIVLNTGTFTDNTEVGIGGSDAALFAVSRAGSDVELRLLEGANVGTDLAEKRYLSVYVQATNPGSDSATAFVVINVERILQPRFAQTYGHGRIPVGSRDVLFEQGSELRIVSSSTEPAFQWNLVGEDYQLFEGSLVDDVFRFSLKESVSDEQLGTRTMFKFSVTLKNPESDTVVSSVAVNRMLPMPQFSKAIYTGQFDGDLRLTLPDPVELTSETFTAGILVTLRESNVDFLSPEQTGRGVELKISRPLSMGDFQGLETVRLVLVATASDDIRGTCTIVLTVPDGTACIPLPPVVECSSCYNCTTGGVLDDVPVFAHGNFRFQMRSDTSGTIGSVTATVKDPSASVQHRLDVTDAYLNERLTITPQGMLSVDEPIVPNIYQFQVVATNTVAGKQATASVVLDVLNRYECTEGEKQPTVEQVLFVQHLEEEKPHGTIFPTRLSPSCSYELISESPFSAEEPYFYIDPETDWLIARSFDREDSELFNGMMVPQFRLVLNLICDSTNEADRRSIAKRSLVETDTINYAPDVTVVSIIVDDINDNDPVFVKPEPWEHLGFPEPSLATKLMLSEVTVSQAVDVDAGLNAKISYSVAENGHFMIDSQTGSIHPKRDALRDSDRIDLTIIATDRDGAADGRWTSTEVTVHRLEENHLAFVYLTMADETTSDAIVEQINREVNFHLKVLRHAYVPEVGRGSDRSGGRQVLNGENAMRLVVYALNDNNQLLNTDDIRSAVRRAVPSITASAIVSFREAVCYVNGNDPSCPSNPSCPDEFTMNASNTGLIASTSVLGALFLICLAVCSVLYIRYVRPLSGGSNQDPSDIVELEKDFDPTPPSTPPSLGTKKEKVSDLEVIEDRKISINISGITAQESEDSNMDSKRLARTLTERLEEEDEYGTTRFDLSPQEMITEPKNVKFNEVVERIEVHEQHSDEDGESSVFEERL